MSNGEQIDRLEGLATSGILEPTLIQIRLIRIIAEQQRRIAKLEQEIFDRCSGLRDRVARLEQPNGR